MYQGTYTAEVNQIEITKTLTISPVSTPVTKTVGGLTNDESEGTTLSPNGVFYLTNKGNLTV